MNVHKLYWRKYALYWFIYFAIFFILHKNSDFYQFFAYFLSFYRKTPNLQHQIYWHETFQFSKKSPQKKTKKMSLVCNETHSIFFYPLDDYFTANARFFGRKTVAQGSFITTKRPVFRKNNGYTIYYTFSYSFCKNN